MALVSLDVYSAVYAAFCCLVYGLCKAIYRVYFSPLSHIPGAKIAIATSWCECYYDVWKRGLYYRKVKAYHQKYGRSASRPSSNVDITGPIVRISPHEVHIDDPSFYDELNNNTHKWDKYGPYMAQFNSPGAVMSTTQHDLHRMRRRPENNFFSKRSVVALEPVIHRHVERLCQRLQEFRLDGSPLAVNNAMLCFTGDVVSEYVFGDSWSLLESADFAPWLLSANKRTGEYSHAMKQWPWLVHVLNAVPISWFSKVMPDVAMILRYQDVVRIRNESSDSKSRNTIVRTLLDSDLPSSEKSTFRLAKESFVLVAAGGDTTGSTIAMLLFHLIDNPRKLAKLRSRLAPLFADSSQNPTWNQLEDVPYMTAVVKEGLRMNQGVVSRIPRCAPDRETHYHGIMIPRGTPVSMSIPDIHENPEIFPNPQEFLPERWLSNTGDPTEAFDHRLEKWLVSFSKGSRQCLGMNLAYAEIYLCVATLIMRYDFELYQTTREDVDWQHDFTVPNPKLGSKLVRVLISRENPRPTRCQLIGTSSPPRKLYVTKDVGHTGELTGPQGIDGQSVHYARGKTLGGCTARNYMAYIRSSRDAYQLWADTVGDSSYEFDNFNTYFEKSLSFTPPNNAEHGANATPSYDTSTLGNGGEPLSITFANYAQAFSTWTRLGLQQIGINPTKGFTSGNLFGSSWVVDTINHKTGFRESSETAFLHPALNRPNLKVYDYTMAKKVLFSGKKATGVSVQTNGTGTAFTLSAKKEVIVSAGAFQSPQLLMVSGVGPSATLQKYGIPVVANRPGVGQNLQDHLYFGINYRVNVITSSALGNPAYAAQAGQLFDTKQAGILSNPGGDLLAFEKVPQSLHSQFPTSVQKDLAAFPSDWPELEYLSVAGYTGYQENYEADAPTDGYQYATLAPALVAPLSRGNISISSADTNMQPLINPNWLTHPADQAVVVAGFKRGRQAYATSALKTILIGPEYFPGAAVQTDAQILENIKKSFNNFFHASATCAMGKSSNPMAVIDPQARVYGVQGLRVVDSSSFPFLPPGQPMGTVYALAEKIADDIRHGD